MTWWQILLLWFLLSVPVGILIGKSIDKMYGEDKK